MDATSIFKFVTIRNASDKITTDASSQISPNSGLVRDLALINESKSNSETKLKEFNTRLQLFIDSPNFIKTHKDFEAALKLSGTQILYNQLFDNIVARTITKSTTNKVYKQLVDQIKIEHLTQNSGNNPTLKPDNARILIPDSLIFSFIQPKPTTQLKPINNKADISKIRGEYNEFLNYQSVLDEIKLNNVHSIGFDGYTVNTASKFVKVNEKLGVASISTQTAKNKIEEQLRNKNRIFFKSNSDKSEIEELKTLQKLINEAQSEGVQNFAKREKVSDIRLSPLLNKLGKESVSVAEVQNHVSQNLQRLSNTMAQSTPFDKFVQIGNQYVQVSGTGFPQLEFDPSTGPKIDNKNDVILVYSNGCWLKFPFQIADLRVVTLQTVGYLPGEIAHIDNTRKGEKNTRTTKRLKRTEEFLSLINEEEVFHETDTQSTEKFGFTKEASNVQSEESSWNINASVSGSYGPIKASVDGGYESSSSSTNSDSSAQTYAKEIAQRVVDRTTKKIKQTRNTTTIEEFREKVVHVIDNSKIESQSIVYRWLKKIVRGTLDNYGKRVILPITFAHPAHFYISQSIKNGENPVFVPDDPRSTASADNLIQGKYHNINRSNYADLAVLYNAKIEAPPSEEVVIFKGFSQQDDGKTLWYNKHDETIEAPEGYKPCQVKPLIMFSSGSNRYVSVSINNQYIFYSGYSDKFNSPVTYDIGENLNGENSRKIIIGIRTYAGEYVINLQIHCKLTEEAMTAWRIKAFQSIIEGYENLKNEAESKMSEFNPNLPGLNPEQKIKIIKDELKRETLRRMFRCNPFGIKDNFEVGVEYQSDCCLDSQNAELVQFLESVFDWRNMTWEFHPWFYTNRDVFGEEGKPNKDNWADLLKLKDDDPHFEAFLKASYATVRVPIHRDEKKEIAALNFIVNNSIANYEVVQEGMQAIVDEMKEFPISQFKYEIDENGVLQEVPASNSSDLGFFTLPTSLVILECGVQDGVKPSAFKDIPENMKQSPAIIADTCPK